MPYIKNARYFIENNNYAQGYKSKRNYKLGRRFSKIYKEHGYKKIEEIINEKINEAVMKTPKLKLPVNLCPIKRKGVEHEISDCLIRRCNKEDCTEITDIQKKVIDDLTAKEDDNLFIPTDDKLIKRYLKQKDIFFICVETPTGICAYSYTFFNNDDEGNLSEHFKNKKVATFDTVVVSPDFRGNKLHDKLLKISIDEAKKDKYNIVAATVAPTNHYSINNFKKNGFKILKNIEYTMPDGIYERHIMYLEI